MTISVSLDRDVEVRVKKYAEGIGVPLETLCERAIIYALSTVYPDQGLPEGGQPDQGLPGEQPEIDNSLPPFDGTIDQELPEGEIPVDPEYGVEEGGGRPSTGNPNLNPNPDVDANPALQRGQGRPDQSLPGTPEPKA